MENKKLVYYSLAATSFLIISETTDAQSVFTDVDPDLVLTIEYSVGDEAGDSIDLNDDGVYDFYIYMSYDFICGYCDGFSEAYIKPLGSNRVAYINETIFSTCYASDSMTLKIVPPVYEGAIIGDDETFTNERVHFFFNDGGVGYCFYPFAGDGTAHEQYIPVQLHIGGANHNGWIRFSLFYNYIPIHTDERHLIIHDFAYNENPDETITTEALANTSVLWKYTNDIADNVNGTDLEFSFYKIADESKILDYRIFAVKSSEPDITLDEALLMPSDTYLSVLPDGSDYYTQTFDASSTDTDGDLITNNISYKLFILVYSDVSLGGIHQLSASSEPITLTSDIDPVSVTLTDIDDNGDASDMKVFFAASETENLIEEYRFMISKDIYLSEEEAFMVLPENYIVVVPDGTSYNENLPIDFKDTDGDIITYGVEYKAFVIAVNNGLATEHKFSSSSPLTLNGITDVAQNIVLSDIDDNGNATDMHIGFDKAVHEATISEYRLMIMPSVMADTFSLADAESLTGFYYYEILPSGSNISETLSIITRDVNGDIIVEGIPYSAYVMSVGSEFGNGNALSAVSNSVTLGSGLFISEAHDSGFLISAVDNTINVSVYENTGVGILTITDMNGKKICETEVEQSPATFQIIIADGMYIVVYRTKDKAYIKKLLVN